MIRERRASPESARSVFRRNSETQTLREACSARLDGATYSEIAAAMNITRERARQLVAAGARRGFHVYAEPGPSTPEELSREGSLVRCRYCRRWK